MTLVTISWEKDGPALFRSNQQIQAVDGWLLARFGRDRPCQLYCGRRNVCPNLAMKTAFGFVSIEYRHVRASVGLTIDRHIQVLDAV